MARYKPSNWKDRGMTSDDSIVVDVLTGRVGSILEPYNYTYNTHCQSYLIWFPGTPDGYSILHPRHLRQPMPGERRAYRCSVDQVKRRISDLMESRP